jgi:hypothetical protein
LRRRLVFVAPDIIWECVGMAINRQHWFTPWARYLWLLSHPMEV